MTTQAGAISNLAVAGFQGLNATYYLVQNDRNYSTGDIISRIHNYVGLVDKAVEKGKHDSIPYYLTMAFSWLMAFGNRFHRSIEDDVWKHFPGVCPYCTGAVCGCGSERAIVRSPLETGASVKPITLAEFQKMFARIYPRNTLSDSSRRLSQEVSELDQAYRFFRGTHRKDLFEKVVEEMVDVFARMCAVATCADIDLAQAMEEQFKDGCPKCHRIPCDEGYTTAQSVPVR